MKDLNPCPFCGSADLIENTYDVGTKFFISCADCDALGPTANSREKARQKWNTRTIKVMEVTSHG